MNSSTDQILQFILFDCLFDQCLLVYKRCDDRNAFVRILLRIRYNLVHLCRGSILDLWLITFYINIHKWMRFPAFRLNLQFGIVIFFIIEPYNFFVATIVIAQKHFIAYGIAGEICFVNRILPVIVFIGHMILPAQFLIRQLPKQNDRVKLLWISHQHQLFSTNDRDK